MFVCVCVVESSTSLPIVTFFLLHSIDEKLMARKKYWWWLVFVVVDIASFFCHPRFLPTCTLIYSSMGKLLTDLLWRENKRKKKQCTQSHLARNTVRSIRMLYLPSSSTATNYISISFSRHSSSIWAKVNFEIFRGVFRCFLFLGALKIVPQYNEMNKNRRGKTRRNCSNQVISHCCLDAKQWNDDDYDGKR